MRLIGNFLCLGTLLCAAAGGGAELLKNSSFETGPAGGIPDNWHFARSGNAEAAFQLDGTEAADGKRSLLERFDPQPERLRFAASGDPAEARSLL